MSNFADIYGIVPGITLLQSLSFYFFEDTVADYVNSNATFSTILLHNGNIKYYAGKSYPVCSTSNGTFNTTTITTDHVGQYIQDEDLGKGREDNNINTAWSRADGSEHAIHDIYHWVYRDAGSSYEGKEEGRIAFINIGALIAKHVRRVTVETMAAYDQRTERHWVPRCDYRKAPDVVEWYNESFMLAEGEMWRIVCRDSANKVVAGLCRYSPNSEIRDSELTDSNNKLLTGYESNLMIPSIYLPDGFTVNNLKSLMPFAIYNFYNTRIGLK